MYAYDRLFIGGEWVNPSTTSMLNIISPTTEETIGRAPEGSQADIDRAIAAARSALHDGPWPRLSACARANFLHALAEGLRARFADFARVQVDEGGAPYTSVATPTVANVGIVLDYYADLAATYPFEEIRAGLMGKTHIVREPVGVVGAIVPWNYSFALSIVKLAPALLAGCTVVLKATTTTPFYSFLLAEVLQEIGLPAGVVNIVPTGPEVSEHLVTHPQVNKISFTGSTATGKRIAALCGQGLKRVNLELGGKSPAILLDDAPVENFLNLLVYSVLPNSGQACYAQTRILVPQSRHDDIVEALCTRVRALVVGDPLDPITEVGPLISARQRDRVEGYIASGLAQGARIAVGGKRPAALTRGWFVEPTIFINVDPSMNIAQEEIFGPVLTVLSYKDEEDAIRLANDSIYGLCGSVWTHDIERGRAVARRIHSGMLNVNTFGFDWIGPFGGFKQSGIGREFGPEGVNEYTELKSILVPAEQ
jgi:aldehyde dehydrogenase (NAD+)